MNDNLTVNGFQFSSEADAKVAREELEKIEYLDLNMNYSYITKVEQLYDRALDSKMFKTPVGFEYLKKLQKILIDNGYLEVELRPIPMSTYFVRTNEDAEPLSERIKPKKKKSDPYKTKYSVAVVIIVGLVISVIAMFAIAMTSETPNMINYRNAIVNEYATWEQEIKDREEVVREKEHELGIVSPLPHE